MDQEPTSEQLLARVAKRDQRALSELYDRFAARLLGLLVRMLPVRSLAEEALRSVFLRLWSEAPNLGQDGGSVAAWLVVAARHTALERLRAERMVCDRSRARTESHRKLARAESLTGKPRIVKSSVAKSAATGAPAAKRRASTFLTAMSQAWIPRPEAIAPIDDRLKLLQNVVNKLPKAQLEALELAVFGGFTETEIAQQLGEPLGKVKTALRAAITFLKHRQRAVLGTWTADI